MPFNIRFLKSPHLSTTNGRPKISTPTVVITFIFVLLTAYVLYIPPSDIKIDTSIKVGDIVNEDIVINKNQTIIDTEQTEELKLAAVENVIPVYIYDSQIQDKTIESLFQWFQLIRETKENNFALLSTDERNRLLEKIEKQFNLSLDASQLQALVESPLFSRVDVKGLISVVNELYEKRFLDLHSGGRISKTGTISLLSSSSVEGAAPVSMIIKIDEFLDLTEVETRLLQFLKQQKISIKTNTPGSPVSILLKLLVPNVFYSDRLTHEEEKKISGKIKPEYIHLKAGKVILRKGDEVTPGDFQIIRLIAGASKKSSKRAISTFYLIALILCCLTLFGTFFFKTGIYSGINKYKLLVVAGATLLVSALAYRISLFLFPIILMNIPTGFQYTPHSIFYAIPFGFGVLVIAFIFNLQSSVIFSFINALIGGIACDWDFKIFIYILIGNIALSFGIEYYQRLKRSSISKATLFWAMPFNIAIITLLNLTWFNAGLKGLTFNILMGLAGGIISAILANFIVPLWESLFKLVTELKLIELTNLNLPVFREMLEKAPGTYHHSLMVASLSEAVAQDLRISPILQRAMALYHDIGKIENPQFFTENHSIYKNPHEKLPPRESAKNIISHIQDGLDRSEKIKIPPILQDAIRQHHGTKRVHYFYDKARETSSVYSDVFDDKAFRYPGEKPQNIQNAIIMLADQVEAASKSLASPSDEEVKNVIQKIIDTNIEEGQFNECEGLTFKALNIIANSFLKKLSSIYHMRISYPGFDFKEKEGKNGSRNGSGHGSGSELFHTAS